MRSPRVARCLRLLGLTRGYFVQTEEMKVSRKLFNGILVTALACALAGCAGDSNTTNTASTNANATSGALPTTAGTEPRVAPDNSEVVTQTAGGVTTQTRTFRNPSSRIERVVVTTRDGRRTARVYYRDNTVRELPENEVERALDATADALVTAGGKAVDVTKDAAAEIGDKAEDVGDKAASGAKKVGSEAADKAEDAGDKAVSGAKKAGSAAAKGAKKAGEAVKDVVTP